MQVSHHREIGTGEDLGVDIVDWLPVQTDK